MRRSGVRRLLLLALLVAACRAPYGFAGGGLPPHVKTMAVLPFENETAAYELQRELHEALRRELRGRLGVRDAAESQADAIVRFRSEHGPIKDVSQLSSILGNRPVESLSPQLDFSPSTETAAEAPGA